VRAVLAWVGLALSATAAADSISSVEVTTLPTLNGASSQARIVAIEERPVVLEAGDVQVLDANRKAWISARWPDGLDPQAQIVSDGHQTFALQGARIAQLQLNSDAPTLRSLRRQTASYM
jgi:hypothetical protein